jgi:hypothetical protein
MNSPTRTEVDAAIDALDGRNERRIHGLETKIDDLIARMDERFLRLEERMDERFLRIEERMARFEERMARFEERLTRVEIDLRDTRNMVSSLKLTVITTAIASVIAIIIGFGAITSSMQTSMLGAFSAGKDDATLYAQNAALQAKMQRQADETDAVLRAIREDLKARPLNPGNQRAP